MLMLLFLVYVRPHFQPWEISGISQAFSILPFTGDIEIKWGVWP